MYKADKPLIPSLQQTVRLLQHLPYAGSVPSIAYKRSSLRIELCLSNMYHLLELNVAQLVRASDQHSEDQGSNPGWISLSFIFKCLCTLCTHAYTHTLLEPRAKGPPSLRLCNPSRWYEPSGPHTRRRTLCRQAHPGPCLHGNSGLGSQPTCTHSHHQGDAGLCASVITDNKCALFRVNIRYYVLTTPTANCNIHVRVYIHSPRAKLKSKHVTYVSICMYM